MSSIARRRPKLGFEALESRDVPALAITELEIPTGPPIVGVPVAFSSLLTNDQMMAHISMSHN